MTQSVLLKQLYFKVFRLISSQTLQEKDHTGNTHKQVRQPAHQVCIQPIHHHLSQFHAQQHTGRSQCRIRQEGQLIEAACRPAQKARNGGDDEEDADFCFVVFKYNGKWYLDPTTIF